MKVQFICCCCVAILSYLIYSFIYEEKVTFNRKGQIENTQTKSLDNFENCSSFVSASCDHGSIKKQFKKLPEKFAKVSNLNFITILLTNFYFEYLTVLS